MESTRIAVVGAGKMSQKIHLPILSRLQRDGLCSLEILCDLNLPVTQEAQEKFGFARATQNAEDIFSESAISAVYLFGTAQMHYEYAKHALLSGKHVFIEKPPAPTAEQAFEIEQLAHSKGLFAAVGFNREFQENIRTVQSSREAGAKIFSAEACFHKPSFDRPAPYGAATWLSSNAIHSIDALLFVMGARPVELYSAFNKTQGEMPQNFGALLKWRNGALATLVSNNTAGSRKEEYAFHTLNTSYYCPEGELVVYRNGEEAKHKATESRGFDEEHEAFLKAVGGDLEVLHNDMRAGAEALHIAELIESGHTGPIEWGSAVQSPDVPVKVSSASIPVRHDRGAILVLNPASLKNLLPMIAQRFNLVFEQELEALTGEKRKEIIAVITGRGGVPISSDTLAALPNLKVAGIVGASVKKYNPEEILKNRIPIINASEAYARAVAEFALMQAMVGVRRASRSHDLMRKGLWGTMPKGRLSFFEIAQRIGSLSYIKPLKPILLPLWKKLKSSQKNKEITKKKSARSFRGRSVGLVGYGATAKEFAKLLQLFGCEIKIASEYLTEEEAHAIGAQKVTLEEALYSDVVSLHRGLSERTRRSFGSREVSLMKPGAVFVNTARGEIVDMDALVDRLRKGDIFACLDVFDTEPLPKKDILRGLPNVFLTSHIAGSTSDMYEDAEALIVHNVLRYLNGEEVAGIITSKEMLANMT